MGLEIMSWRTVRCLLASPPGVRSVEGRFLVDGADSSRFFLDVSPDEGDQTGRNFRSGDNAFLSGRIWLVPIGCCEPLQRHNGFCSVMKTSLSDD